MAISAQDAIDALKESHGLVSVAAKKLGVSRATVHAMINKMPTVREARIDAKEALKDFAESRIFKEIEAGNTTMIIFFAKTQMKDRGYIERQEISGADDTPFTLKVIYGERTNNSPAESS